jgi:hypothetical protein
MPWVRHFRFVRPWPERLLFRDGAIELVIREITDSARWYFVAVKLNQARKAKVICAASTRHGLDRMLFSDGFRSVAGPAPTGRSWSA